MKKIIIPYLPPYWLIPVGKAQGSKTLLHLKKKKSIKRTLSIVNSKEESSKLMLSSS